MTDAAAKTPNIRWRVAALLFFATVINYVDRQTLSVLAVQISDEFGLSNIEYSQHGSRPPAGTAGMREDERLQEDQGCASKGAPKSGSANGFTRRPRDDLRQRLREAAASRHRAKRHGPGAARSEWAR